MRIMISLAAVAAIGLCAAPAAAQHRDDQRSWNNNADHRGQRGDQRNWNNADHRGQHGSRLHRQRWSSGYRFGPSYSYTSYDALPRTYVSRYHLSRRDRYVYQDGYIYQVDPTTYAVTRVIQALTGR